MSVYNYIGFLTEPRADKSAPKLFAFYASAKDVIKWATVKKVEDSPEGTQRVLRKPRRNAIRRFLESSSINTIPNSILVAFTGDNISLSEEEDDSFSTCDNAGSIQLAQLSIDNGDSNQHQPGFIVDGQHRVFGMSDLEREDLPILVVALLDADLDEQAFQFIVINNKSVRVPTDNVKAIIANYDETRVRDRLLDAGVRYGENSPMLKEVNTLDISPFKNLLQWPNTREDGTKLVPITAIEQCMKKISKEFPIFISDEDSRLGVFINIWSAVKDAYPSIWGKENKLMKKVSIIALNEFLVTRVKAASQLGLLEILDAENLNRILRGLLKKVPIEFWSGAWPIRIQDNANVREMIKNDIETMVDNAVVSDTNWYEGLKLVISQ